MGAKLQPNFHDWFCWFCWFQPCSRREAAKGTTVHIQATRLTMVPGHITAEAQSWSQLATGRTTAGPGIGTAERIMSGGLVTGRGGMGSKYGSVAITSCEDSELRGGQYRRCGSRLPSCDQSTQQAKKSADECFRKIVAL
jgi:hypothetical protein